jgi:hypothetical protein
MWDCVRIDRNEWILVPNPSTITVAGGTIDEVTRTKNSDKFLVVAFVFNLIVMGLGAYHAYQQSSERPDRVVDHDLFVIDRVADRLIAFEWEPSQSGYANFPQSMRNGMSAFLSALGITFRRDERTGRPRVNKPGSQLDRKQKSSGEYYYRD